MNIKFLVVLLILVGNVSCENLKPLPEDFCCKVNGKKWTPTIKGSFGGKDTGNASYKVNTGFFDISGSSEDCYLGMTIKFKPNTEIEINKKYPIELILQENQAGASFGRFSSTNSTQNIVVKASNGFVKITKMDGQYFSGTFEYDLEKKIESKTYKIRNGQFNNMIYGRYTN